MNCRLASLSDLDNLVILFEEYRAFYEQKPAIEKAVLFLTARITKKDSVIYVADVNGFLAGFVQLYPLFSSTRMEPMWLLNDLFVENAHRGKGISLQLIDAAKAHCIETKACGLLLETAKTNVIGNKLYPKTGFSLDTDHNYYWWQV
jgi:GNAT superfamily N-acetyltransferase